MIRQEFEAKALGLIMLTCLGVALEGGEPRGVVIEKIPNDSVLKLTGVQPGDVFFRWERLANPPSNQKAAAGVFVSPFDWKLLEIEQAPRGVVKLYGERNGVENTLSVPLGLWKAQVRSVIKDDTRYLRGKRLIDKGDIERGLALWKSGSVNFWLEYQIGEIWARVSEWDKACASYEKALSNSPDNLAYAAMINKKIAYTYEKRNDLESAYEIYASIYEGLSEKGLFDLLCSEILNGMGVICWRVEQFDQSHKYHEEALRISTALAPDSHIVSSSIGGLSNIYLAQGNYSEARLGLEKTLITLKKHYKDTSVFATCLTNLGTLYAETKNKNKAREFFKKALSIFRKIYPHRIEVATCLNNLATLEKDSNNFEVSLEYYKEASEIMRKLDPSGFQLAPVLSNIGSLYGRMGDLKKEERYYLDGYDIVNRLKPDGPEIINHLMDLGVFYSEGLDLNKAESFLKRALEIIERHEISMRVRANCLNNLGIVYFRKGELDKSEKSLDQARSIFEELSTNSVDLANCLENLGNTLWKRGELDASERFHQQALEIYKMNDINDLRLATSLANIGNIKQDLGDLNGAEVYYEKALEVYRTHAGNSLYLAGFLHNLGNVLFFKGAKYLERSKDYYLEAVEILNSKAPDSLNLAVCLNSLANLYHNHDKLKKAELYLHQSLKIKEQLAPGSQTLSDGFYNMGRILYEQGRKEEAIIYLNRAIDTFEKQTTSIGGSLEAQTLFRGSNKYIYHELFSGLANQGDIKKSFETLERYRSRILLDIISSTNVKLKNRERNEKLLNELASTGFKYQKKSSDLMELTPSDPEYKTVKVELIDIRRRYNKIRSDIRDNYMQNSPFEAVTLAEAQNSIERGTIVLSFGVTRDQLFLFSLTRSSIKMHTISKGEEFWRDKVGEILDDAFLSHSKIFTATFKERSAELFTLLIKPVMPEIEKAERVLIISDGSLRKLPFALLFDKKNEEYFIEKKPLSSVVSVSVYSELKKRPPKSINHIVAIGDPIYPFEDEIDFPANATLANRSEPKVNAFQATMDNEQIDFVVRSRMGRQGKWERLPWTGQEVNRIAKIFDGKVDVYLREMAKEDVIKELEKQTDIIHISAHAYTDDYRALDSGLVLTINDDFKEGEENGILHAWEIIERVDTEADLVVLSACQTGLGRDAGGEGLLGLTHAFQFAGARSIIASFWNVNDISSAVLMERFYSYLKAGYEKDKALQQAQIDLIRNKILISQDNWLGRLLPSKEFDASHPFFWAGFQLIGPWD